MPGREDEVVVELLAEVGADHRHLGGVDADAVTEVEVRHPRLAAAVGRDRRARQVAARRTGLRHVEHGVEDLAPLVELRLLARRRLLTDDPGAAEVGAVAAVADARRRSTARRPRPARARWSAAAGQVAVSWSTTPSAFDVGHHLPDRVEHVGVGAELEGAAQERAPTDRSAAHRAPATPGRRPSPAR